MSCQLKKYIEMEKYCNIVYLCQFYLPCRHRNAIYPHLIECLLPQAFWLMLSQTRVDVILRVFDIIEILVYIYIYTYLDRYKNVT